MSFLDSLLGNSSADASNAAATDTYAKQKQATGALTEYGNTLPGQYNQLAQGYQPYVQAGGSALQQLMSGLGLGGQGGQEQFTAAYQGLPGYQSGLATGQHAAESALNARHIGQSGGAAKQLYRYGSDYENQRSGDYLNRLTGMAGMGQQATGQQIGTQAAGLQGQLQTRQSAFGGDMNSAGTVGQGMVAGAQAQQQGLTNLMGMGASLGGSLLGGGFGTGLGNNLFGTTVGQGGPFQQQSPYKSYGTPWG